MLPMSVASSLLIICTLLFTCLTLACNKDTKYYDEREYCTNPDHLKMENGKIFRCENQWVGSGKANLDINSTKERVWVERDYNCPENFQPQIKYEDINCVNSDGDITAGTSTVRIQESLFCRPSDQGRWLRFYFPPAPGMTKRYDYIFQCDPEASFLEPFIELAGYPVWKNDKFFDCRHEIVFSADRSAVSCERRQDGFAIKKDVLEQNLSDAVDCKADDDEFTSANGGCRDLTTGLVWGTDGTFKPGTLKEAITYCATYRGCGFDDWRMPTQEELSYLAFDSLAEKHLAIDLGTRKYPDHFDFIGTVTGIDGSIFPAPQSLLYHRAVHDIIPLDENHSLGLIDTTPRVICVR
jgi:hypothetical protein